MDYALNIIKNRHLQPQGDERENLTPVPVNNQISKQKPSTKHYTRNIPNLSINTPHDALHILRSQPDQGDLVRVLNWLSEASKHGSGLDIKTPGPLQAQILNCLLTRILPDFWRILPKDDRNTIAFLFCSVSGVCAVFSHMKSLLVSVLKTQRTVGQVFIIDVLELVHYVIRGDNHILTILHGLRSAVRDGVSRDLAWKEYLNLITSGKIVTLSAQAFDTIGSSIAADSKWLASGHVYSMWLGRNISQVVMSDEAKYSGELLGRGLSIGYSSDLLSASLVTLLDGCGQDPSRLEVLWKSMSVSKLQPLLDHIGRWLSGLTDLLSKSLSEVQFISLQVPAMAGILVSMLNANEAYVPLMSTFISDTAAASWMSLPFRQACVTSIILQQPHEAEKLLDRLISIVGDRLFIRHATTTQQDGLVASTILVAAGLQLQSPEHLRMLSRTSRYLSGISNRLDASSQRARWLGMILSMAISSMVDDDRLTMKFESADMHTEEAKTFLRLAQFRCQCGHLAETLSFLKSCSSGEQKEKPQTNVSIEGGAMIKGKPVFGPPRPPLQGGQHTNKERVVEIFDVSDTEASKDHELKPYAKPGDDPEDSDEDASLVNRNKLRPPVYVRDLIKMIGDRENHDNFLLGIQHAAKLIRRKSSFGKEVHDHGEELARILCNLQDPFDIDSFEELRLQALVAVVLSDVKLMGPWFAKQSFAGEYSLSQRGIILVALGLAGRELADLKDLSEDAGPGLRAENFPSKQLPKRLHDVYAPTSSALRRIEDTSKIVTDQMIQPLALEAADQQTSHLNAVKLRKFSMQKSSAQRKSQTSRSNLLAKELNMCFFTPLVIRYQQDIAAYGMTSIFKTTPLLLTTFLRTLAILIHAGGPGTLGLPHITSEFWQLLLSLRMQALSDISILDALLFAMLTLLEVNQDSQHLAVDNAQQIMETKEWVGMILDRTGGGKLIRDDGSAEAKIRTLSAAVLVKLGDIIETYQKLLVGTSLDY